MFLRYIFLTGLISLSACSWFQGKDDEPSAPKPPRTPGVFHPGPYTSPEGKTCNAPGGYCESDKACHSSAAKCPSK